MRVWFIPCIVLLLAGCELAETETADQGWTSSNDATTASTATAASTATTSDGSTAATDVDLSGAEVEGAYNFTWAAVTASLTGCSVNGAYVSLTWDEVSWWPTYDGACNGVVCAIWRSGSGGWIGGYFDYLPIGTSYTWGLFHITDGYGGPGTGAEVGFFIMNYDGTERSNVIFTTWP